MFFANPVRILSASLGQGWGAMGSRAVGLYKEGPGSFPGPSRSQATAGRQRFGDSAGGRSMAGVFCLAREIELGLAGLQRSRQNTSKAPLRYQILSNASGRPRRPSKGNRPTLQKAKKKEENGQDLQNSGTCGNLGPSKTLPPENIGLLPNSATQPWFTLWAWGVDLKHLAENRHSKKRGFRNQP